jgi:glycosyltransferase involved in cell wall biosynthesis
MQNYQTQSQPRQAQTARKLKLALVSCGLGNVNRGFEVSTGRWFEVLKTHPDLDVRLYTGGKHPGGSAVLNIPRDWVMQSPLAVFKPINRRRYWEFCYGVEQISYGLFYWPDLVKFQPDIVWTKEVPFGYFLPAYRAAFGMSFKTIFANGGAFRPGTYKCFDYIQHLTQESYEEALAYGIPAHKMQTLTNSILFRPTNDTREQVRSSLGFAADDYVVMCVAAWNAYHKRLDYLIDEVAAINDPTIKLLLCGHPDAETAQMKQLADDKLPGRVQWLTLSESQVHRAMKGADVFVLPSVTECLGNSIAEAIMGELPVIVHSTTASRFIFGSEESEWFADLSRSGALAARLMQLRRDPSARQSIALARPRVQQLFSPEALVPRFYQMAVNLHNTARGAGITSGAGIAGSAGGAHGADD